MKTKWYLKVTTNSIGSPFVNSWNGRYPIGKWLPKRQVSLCSSGWHATNLEYLDSYLSWYRRI